MCVCFFSLLYSLSITFIHSLIFLPFVCIYPCWLCVCVFFFVLFSFCVHYFQFPHPFAQCFHCVCTEMSFTISCIFLPFGCVLFYSLFFYFSLIFYVDYDFNWILSFFSSRIVFLIWNKYFSWLFHFVIGFFLYLFLFYACFAYFHWYLSTFLAVVTWWYWPTEIKLFNEWKKWKHLKQKLKTLKKLKTSIKEGNAMFTQSKCFGAHWNGLQF